LPPFEQLRRQLIEQITIGQLRADTKLPAVRRLAADLALAPGTVARAYKELVSEGYLVSRGRNGTVVAPNISDEPQTQAQRITNEGSLHLAVSNTEQWRQLLAAQTAQNVVVEKEPHAGSR